MWIQSSIRPLLAIDAPIGVTSIPIELEPIIRSTTGEPASLRIMICRHGDGDEAEVLTSAQWSTTGMEAHRGERAVLMLDVGAMASGTALIVVERTEDLEFIDLAEGPQN